MKALEIGDQVTHKNYPVDEIFTLRARTRVVGKATWAATSNKGTVVDYLYPELLNPVVLPQPEYKARPHADLIKAWADGAEIEFCNTGTWYNADVPAWHPNTVYRIKPEPVSTPKIPRAVFEKAKSRSHRKYTLRLAKLRQQQAALNLQVSALQLAYEAKNSRQAAFAKEHVE